MKSIFTSILLFSLPLMAGPLQNVNKVSNNLENYLNQNISESSINIWVYFTDKNISDLNIELARIENSLSTKTKWRRNKTRDGAIVDIRDIQVSDMYINEILDIGGKLRTTSKWLNAISMSVNPDIINQLAGLTFVDRVDLVFHGKRIPIDTAADLNIQPNSNNRVEYGDSFGQLDQINAIAAHDAGYKGQGVLVLMLDTGYYKDHEAMPGERIITEWDFINNDGETQNEPTDPESAHNHGTYTTTTLGGAFEGQLYGPAYEAEFLLAKTEDVGQEEPIEEDWYVAGLEWGELLGADVASSSLGYIDWYTFDDLDGETAVTTIAVTIAIENGMTVTTAAGNYGENGIIAPADAFDVITCGAVNVDGEIAGFSSHGPTADGRIKPDVCAQGVNTYCANIDGPSSYRTANGTSLSTPLVGGAVAIILSARPNWTPYMIREALMMTADNVDNPDNQYGWGTIDIMAAIDYFSISGDVNNDAVLDVLDLVLIVNFILGPELPTEEQLNIADINNDGILDVIDLVQLVAIIIGES
ncbi:MAG: S8 family serine peptidase [Candidatus Marinimicrobia bacterium]|mgnify:CR=1 FL=1|jgi:serine protease AprX|nr:S8 family serine peptidase [Candidatus Neomarinimicrobiota bacterium]MBT3633722.1 S8 family serine peptidase [Candidatus Neomarinimicrobiota bacterium]MBT3682514.1 S8 family serine peptidase [Candidatus Neomarinimicrobiota bacterium]MBT3759278.1 S8 family serine peptidase [Candidatus Neomarinimicrobiota bacterium]MBT3894714.1 S8 family serine peptidase [Candidatus Neomarinimicrobiota bacterium]